jgi:DNA repair protein RadC
MAKYTGTAIKRPDDIVDVLSAWRNRRQEHFLVITLTSSHDVIKVHAVSKGTISKTMVHPREVFYHAIVDNASAVAIAHNHPSGKVFPSSEDDEITEYMKEAAQLLGFHLIDHVVIAKNDFHSYRQLGNM